MTPEQTIAPRLLRAWNDLHPGGRDRILAKLLADDLHYRDPHFAEPICGRTAYLDFVSEVRGRFPELRFELVGASSHHGVGLIDWSLALHPSAGRSLGSFFFELNGQSQIRCLVGFARTGGRATQSSGLD